MRTCCTLANWWWCKRKWNGIHYLDTVYQALSSPLASIVRCSIEIEPKFHLHNRRLLFDLVKKKNDSLLNRTEFSRKGGIVCTASAYWWMQSGEKVMHCAYAPLNMPQNIPKNWFLFVWNKAPISYNFILSRDPTFVSSLFTTCSRILHRVWLQTCI